jgi:hypothetical protein
VALKIKKKTKLKSKWLNKTYYRLGGGGGGKCLQGPRPVSSVGPQGTVVGCWLDALLFIRTNEDRERKTHFSLHLKASTLSC